MNKMFAVSLHDMIRTHVPCTSNAQILNWPEGSNTDDVIKDSIWVWLGFVKPGTHSIVVKDVEERIFT